MENNISKFQKWCLALLDDFSFYIFNFKFQTMISAEGGIRRSAYGIKEL